MYTRVHVCLFYLSSLIRPTLKHQRPQEELVKTFDSLTDWYKRGITKGPAATKFRKGACENCGSMTHKKKDCLEVLVYVHVYCTCTCTCYCTCIYNLHVHVHVHVAGVMLMTLGGRGCW